VLGNGGNDTINAGAGSDTVRGGDGADQIWGGAQNDSLYGDAGADQLFSGTGDDQLFGGTENDSLMGQSGNDTLFGGDGNDFGSGGTGNDQIFGGTGNDSLRGDMFNISTFVPYAETAGSATTASITNASTMSVDIYRIDSAGNPVFIATLPPGSPWSGTANTGQTYVVTQPGTMGVLDVIPVGETSTYTFNPTFDDTIEGGEGNDTIRGEFGNDLLRGGTGSDSLFGGVGNDSVFGGLGIDYVELGDGNDSFGNFDDEGGNDTVFGGAGNDYIIGGGEDDMLYGGDGNDTLSGGIGSDSQFGGAGDDIFLVTDDHAFDSIDGGTGRDYIAFGNFTTQNGVNIVFTGSDRGTYQFGGGSTSGTFENVEGIWATEYADTVDASADANGVEVYTHGGDDVVFGGSGADTIGGGAGDDLIYGGAGDDFIEFGTGNDTVFGGDGNDIIDDNTSPNSTTGNTLIYGGAGNDTIWHGGGADTVYGGDGNDYIDDHSADIAGASSLFGGAGDDTIWGGLGRDTLDGGTGNDEIRAGSDADLIIVVSDSGIDTIFGGEGGDDFDTLSLSGSDPVSVVMTGSESGTYSFGGGGSGTFSEIEMIQTGSGSDTVDASGSGSSMLISSGAGDDVVTGGAGADTFFGGSGTDRLDGGAGADSLFGGDDADVLTGGAGNDLLDGGAGTDRAVFAGPVTEYSFDRGSDGALIVTDRVAGRDGTDTLTGIEKVTFNGVTYTLVTGDDGSNTTLQGPDDGTPSLIIAHDGNDWGGGHTTSDAIFGGAGNDTLDGGDGDDTLVGEGDNDLLRGDGGNDSLLGGDGQDTLEGGAGNDILQGGAGNDTLAGGTGSDRMEGGDGADVFVIEDGFGRDTVIGGEGGDDRDRLDMSRLSDPVTVVYRTSDGGTANTPTSVDDNVVAFSEIEEFTLTEGSDAFYGGANTSGVEVDGGGGNDTIYAGQGNDTLSGGDGDDEVFGSSGDDVIDGGAGNDDLGGDEGNDTVFGGAGADYVQGMAGDDSVSGGDGNDTVVGGQGSDILTGGAGQDVIVLTTDGGRDTVSDFDMTRIDGRTADQLDVSDLTTVTGAPVTWRDVRVTSTNGDGTGDAVLTFPNGESVVLTGVSPDEANGKSNLAQMGIPCFATGTPILTPDGWVRVEDLGTGDTVVTQDQGAVPVLWAGGRRLDAAALMARPALCPVRIALGALGNHDSLLLSPQHGVLMMLDDCDAVLVRATHLARFGYGGFRVAHGIGQVGYHHLLLPRHAVINAAGAAVESLYPGRMALSALGPVAHVEVAATLLARLGTAELPPMGLGGLAELYGPRVAPVMSARQVEVALAKGRLRPALPWGDRDSAVA
jgi:Ca2+-binding RTX toxin-like protein